MEPTGRRLLSRVVDYAAQREPERLFAVILRDLNVSDGFQNPTMKELAHVVTPLCWWIEKAIGPAISQERLAYIGINDVRYYVFVLACQKLGYKAFYLLQETLMMLMFTCLKQLTSPKIFFSEERRTRVLEIQELCPNCNDEFSRLPWPKSRQPAAFYNYVQRQAILRDYDADLAFDLNVPFPETTDRSSIVNYVHQTVSRKSGKSCFLNDQNIHNAGLDSLTTIQIAKILQRGLQQHRLETKEGTITPQVVHANPNVYRLNRSDAETRQNNSFSKKGLVLLGKPQFDLERAKYEEMAGLADTVIYNAWKVSFYQSVESFETHINGVRNFIDFSLQSRHNAHIHFISSVSTVEAWTRQIGLLVPKEPIEDSDVVLQQGYGESEYIRERICLEAFCLCYLR
ncbi:NRPS-like enzyme [Aspergillus affinis]|uniref:NRPS-like enzyme n=1 Tax=Aspergillus affinis TaxID=1070780 RepID=UPI0022FE983D|nr:NRPS-like enzyme [Aspergillus affinis]KAI9037627.1 NRPS-like enzyme [Aspergillus affinis]